MCLYPKLIKNRKYIPNKKNGGNVPIIKDQRTQFVPVGCGNCIECRKQKARSWQIRLKEELKTDNKCYYITLTFAPEELNKLCKETRKGECNAIASIAVRRFTERWRKSYKKTIKHWFITELGHENTERIHLHGIIWTNKIEEVQKYWKYGIVDIGEYCNEQTINYIMKYVTKIDTDHKGYIPIILTSKGIGKGYLKYNKYTHRYKPLNTREYYISEDGTYINMPIYYRNHIYTEEERELLWLEKLNKNEIYILGTPHKVDTEENIKKYEAILKKAQETNKLLGYGDDSKQWKKQEYNITLRMLNIEAQKKHFSANNDNK